MVPASPTWVWKMSTWHIIFSGLWLPSAFISLSYIYIFFSLDIKSLCFFTQSITSGKKKKKPPLESLAAPLLPPPPPGETHLSSPTACVYQCVCVWCACVCWHYSGRCFLSNVELAARRDCTVVVDALIGVRGCAGWCICSVDWKQSRVSAGVFFFPSPAASGKSELQRCECECAVCQFPALRWFRCFFSSLLNL